MTQPAPIPQPKPDPLLGNIRELEPKRPLQSLLKLASTYGPIYHLAFPGATRGRRIFVSSHELINELCDETRFTKKIHASLGQLRDLGGDGLFTAHGSEPNWRRAHNILMPAFGPLAIRDMFPQMQDIAEQMLLRWERFGSAARIDVADSMTRLTLDTIALCAFDYRFNSFYQNDMHPFVDAMVEALDEAGARSRRPPALTKLMPRVRRRYDAHLQLMHGIADQLVAERKRDPRAHEKKDLLARMLGGRDPQSGEGLSDENIRYQLVTFLIAGHETTSGLLSFALYFLLQNPETLRQARAEVDEILGGESPTVHDLPRLTYVDQVLKETLRIWPTAPAFGVKPRETTVIGGRYQVTPHDTLMVLLPNLHRDPAVWGPDADEFKPERFESAAFAALPDNAWKPFGNGERACIGRPFAMQEAQLVLASVLQRFDLTPADPHYQLRVKEALTLKPDGFYIHAKRRDEGSIKPRRTANAATPLTATAPGAARSASVDTLPLLVLYGSESGSSEAFAQRIAADAALQGYQATVRNLDEQAGSLPDTGAVVIVTASYEGKPPLNARQFVAWAESLGPEALGGVRYTVFGCGNRDWHKTYQAVPKQLDALLAGAGAQRVKPRGEADASADFHGDFERWYETLWPDLAAALGRTLHQPSGPQLSVEVLHGQRARALRLDDLHVGEIIENRELVDLNGPLGRSKRHLEIKLPAGATYRAGDYLAVLPSNPASTVERALKRFNLTGDDHVILHHAGGTPLPTGQSISAFELLARYVELAQPASRKQVETLTAATRCPHARRALQALSERYDADLLARRVSVLDLLERFAACELPFAEFLTMLPALRARQYSISSSPLWRADHCTLTVAVVDAPALSGQGSHQGVASTFLRDARPGARIPVAVRPSKAALHPPQSPRTPMIMVCAGTGLAPFRGFLQERALQRQRGETVGPALLFFGCDHPDVDFLYREELQAWADQGVVDVRPAFTYQPDGDVKFVQHRLWQDRADVTAFYRQGAHIYVCGDGKHMAPAVRETFIRIYQEAAGVTPPDAQAWAENFEATSNRYATDVFA